jgi:G:T/U-mismatch repair DNA glycosylase
VYKTYEQTQETEYNKRSNSKDNSFKFEEGAVPLDRANFMHKKIETLKRNEALRIIKIYIAKENEAFALERVKKIFRALFSKREAPEFLQLFMREKRVHFVNMLIISKMTIK